MNEMTVGMKVKLNKAGWEIREERMRRWKGTVLDILPDGWIRVKWYAATICDSCGVCLDIKIWTERQEFLREYVPFEAVEDAA